MSNPENFKTGLRLGLQGVLFRIAAASTEAKLTSTILIAVAALALWLAPSANTARAVVFRAQQDGSPTGLIGAGKLAVFTVKPSGGTRRVGHARITERDTLNVTLYDSTGLPAQENAIAVLLQADLQLLWSAMSDNNRTAVRSLVDSLVVDVQQALAEVARSPEFRDKYRRRLSRLVRKAAREAVDDPRVAQAFAELPVGQIFGDRELRRRLIAVFTSTGIENFMNRLSRGLNRGVEPVRREIFDDPQLQEMISARINDLVRSDAFADLVTEFGQPFFGRLLADADLIAALQEIASDPVFEQQFAKLEKVAVNRMREIVRLIIGLDQRDRLHPLAATVVRSLLSDDSRWLVLVATEHDLALLRQRNMKGTVLRAVSTTP